MLKKAAQIFSPRYRWWAVALVALIAASLLPIPGEVLIVPEHWRETSVWPRVRLEPAAPKAGERVTAIIADTVPWPHVKLLLNGAPIEIENYADTNGYWEWRWTFEMPDPPAVSLAFYHNCHTGCREWENVSLGLKTSPDAVLNDKRTATKLGIVFAQPERDWHNRSGWDVELTYALKAEAEYWGIDDLSFRVENAVAKGLRVLVRIDFDPGQSLPPPDDYLALTAYLDYARRLARDARLQGVYGYIIGSGYNSTGSNSQSPDRLVTPEWYARVFNGYNTDPLYSDNVIQIIHAENPNARVLVGPVRPWIADQDGPLAFRVNQPWLNYMNSVVAFVSASAQAKAAQSIGWVGPDGFAVQAPGRPEAVPANPAEEPLTDVADSRGAQAGFRVYRDWLAVINAHPQTQGLPIYITSTNTFDPSTDVKPSQNYPPGWLSNALATINQEPQVLAVCWFLDGFPMDEQWAAFSLTNPQGLLVNAADEFDALLKLPP